MPFPTPVPGEYPSNFSVDVTSSTSAYLSWMPPPDESHNGDIVLYVVNVTVQETGERFQLTSETTYLEVTNLRPYRTYVCVIAAATSVGLGPFSTTFMVQTPEDGKLSFKQYARGLRCTLCHYSSDCFTRGFHISGGHIKVHCAHLGSSSLREPKWGDHQLCHRCHCN